MLLNKKNTIAGSSLVLNIVLIIINFLGLSFLVMGYHPSFEGSALLLKILGYALLIISLFFLFLFKGMILYSYAARIIVGGLFIVSGLIKANDPKGFAYKLEEYFEDGALAFRIKEWFNWETFTLEFLIDYALAISIIILIFEIVLGMLILLGVKLKQSSWLLVLLMLFFTFLTWHTKECDPEATFADVDKYEINSSIAQAKIAEAEYNDNIEILKQNEKYVKVREVKRTQCVNDCGCFGDAMKGSLGRSLTPAESFWKDIVLLYLGIIIFISRRKVGLNDARENVIMIAGGVLFISFFSFIFSWYFPVFFGLFGLILTLWFKRAGGKWLGNEYGMILFTILLSILFTTYTLMYLPMKDYRPYHVGSNLIERMNDGVEGEYLNIMVYRNKNTNADTSLTNLDESTKEIWSDTETWEFVSRETKTIKEGILPSIQQFDPSSDVYNLTDIEKNFEPVAQMLTENQAQYVQLINKENGDINEVELEEFEYIVDDIDTSVQKIGDTIQKLDEYFSTVNIKDYILEQEQIIIIFSRILKDGDFRRMNNFKEIVEQAEANNIPIVMITTSGPEDIATFREQTGLLVPTFQNDDIEIKAITRSNPTLMVIGNATVLGKYPYRSIPSWKWLTSNVIKIEK